MKWCRKWMAAVLIMGMFISQEEVFAEEVSTVPDVTKESAESETFSEITIEMEESVETTDEKITDETRAEIKEEIENVLPPINEELEAETSVILDISEEVIETPVIEASENKVDISSYENQGVAQFVNRMYEEFLNRDPDQSGFDDWYNKLVSGELQGANIIEGFAASEEFEALNLEAEDYFDIMYHGIFDRAPDEVGLATWTPIYGSGVSASYIPAQFVGSDEFTALCNKFNISRGSITLTQNRDVDPTITEFVNHFYDKCLDRTGEEDGLNDWTGKLLEQISTGADISHGFIYSDEFQNKNLKDNEFIETLYQTLLMRKPDAAGLADWMNRLDNGVSKEYIRAGFVHSAEFDDFCTEHGIKRGNVVLTEARDQNYDLTCTVNELYQEANQKKPSGDVLNKILTPMYSGEVSAHEMVKDMFNKDIFRNKTDKEYIEALYWLVLQREPDENEMKTALVNIEEESREYALDRILIGKEFSDMCLAYGVELMDYMDVPAMKYAKEVLDELGWDLEAGFKWSYTGIRYQSTAKPAAGVSHTQYYGKYGYEKRVGNCYVMASAFYWMAKINGWEVYLVEGYVPTARGYDAIHGWLEVIVDGETYVCDPSGARKGLNAYMVQYGQKGTYMYKNYQRYD